MPIYEYHCETCGSQFDQLFLSVHQVPAEITCPTCHSTTVRRLLSVPASTRRGQTSPDMAETPSEPAKPPVFGRKELNEVLKNK